MPVFGGGVCLSVRVVRYMPLARVQEFFEDGSLFLSSFERFRQHPDERRRDPLEGHVNVRIQQGNADGVVLGVSAQPTYVLCASLAESGVSHSKFGGAGIVIEDAAAFLRAVAPSVPTCQVAYHGPCVYREDNRIDRCDPSPFVGPDQFEDPALEWPRYYNALVWRHATYALFVKRMTFAEEREYRFLWMCERSSGAAVVIQCPEARTLCSVWEGQ